ncbi:MAG TPA: YggT family protein [Gaiellaceae bacterium]|uniref:YggT family protein n=1 Tax=Humibacter sp. TaxID=1940291 RepID=UPI002BFB056F|nr:YggT family protein [Humibacter sp.]HVX08637.1 YggT family protein [Humibacter sp.]HWB23252.1 YggT family protein [Gaiellaceae bacterium]
MPLAVSIIATVAYYVFLLFFVVLWVRFVLDLVRTFARSWRPRGFGLLLAEAAFTVTDPPIKFFRRLLPPLSLGPVALDFGWTLTMFACIIGMYIASSFIR